MNDILCFLWPSKCSRLECFRLCWPDRACVVNDTRPDASRVGIFCKSNKTSQFDDSGHPTAAACKDLLFLRPEPKTQRCVRMVVEMQCKTWLGASAQKTQPIFLAHQDPCGLQVLHPLLPQEKPHRPIFSLLLVEVSLIRLLAIPVMNRVPTIRA